LISCKTKASPRTNWAGNLNYSTDNLFTPGDITYVAGNNKKMQKGQGLGHQTLL
jgi:xylitol oxidase